MEEKAKSFLQRWFPNEVFTKKRFPDKNGISIDYVNKKNNIFVWVTGGEESYIRENGTTQKPQTPKNLENKLGELLFVLKKWKEIMRNTSLNKIKTIIFFYNIKDQAYYTRDFISTFWDVAFDLDEEKIIKPNKNKKKIAKLLIESEINDIKKPFFVTQKVMDVPAIKGSSKLAHNVTDIPLINQIWRNMDVSQVIQNKNIDLNLLRESIEQNIKWLKEKQIGEPIVKSYENGDFETLIKTLAVPKYKHLFAPEEWYLGKIIENFLKKNITNDLSYKVSYGGDFELPNILTREDSPLFIGGPSTEEDIVIELKKGDNTKIIAIQVRVQSSKTSGKKNYLNDCRRLACRNFLLKWNIIRESKTKFSISKSNIIYFVVLDGFWIGPKTNPRKGINIMMESSCPEGIFFFSETPQLLQTIRNICLTL
jgi:hypothetical protein